jgi:hypothetical protein
MLFREIIMVYSENHKIVVYIVTTVSYRIKFQYYVMACLHFWAHFTKYSSVRKRF